ncbi:PstA family ABC transporter permease [Myceligenerans pegani]|uniref:Phosphate ABC transporter permease PstA n=1 Tax=Myceligenerans pegani TaxID=2776917 RepID=A0ABR9N2Z2_9MICO|nr:PstA family ABC transporter permease [Myceligenerans sp. TRM 65318]MBE1877646.1 phosphate ABC transporter permease PstA [Myceligenerans sp. TRM 65318]MBE3019917.1 phosphate ABC transporter permease PstA [Myceligenerans sp. TRM 65318]
MTATETPAGTPRTPRRADRPGRYTRTHLPGRDGRVAPPPPETRRVLSGLQRKDVLRVVGAAAAGIATTEWLFTQVLPVQGALPFVLISYVFFLGYFVILISFDDDRVTIKDRVAGVVIHSGAIVLLLALAVVVSFALAEGAPAFLRLNFWTQDLSLAGPLDPLTVGGMVHAAVGTLFMITLALAISIPLGVLTAVCLAEFPSPFTRIVRTVTEAMTALPSILCGLFILATYVLMFGLPQSGFAAALAITIMILPIIVRSADVVLRLVPQTLKEASFAMGASHWATIWHVVLPTSRSGLATAIVLGTARGIGETSPIMLVAGYTTYMNWNPFTGPMVSLPYATFTLVQSPEPTQIARGFGAAAVLMVMVFGLFALARVIGGKGAGQLSSRGAARARRASARLAARFGPVGLAAAGGTTAAEREAADVHAINGGPHPQRPTDTPTDKETGR